MSDEAGTLVSMCEQCITEVALDSFGGGVATMHGKMPSPLPLCAMHEEALEEKFAKLGLPAMQSDKSDKSEMN